MAAAYPEASAAGARSAILEFALGSMLWGDDGSFRPRAG